MTENLRLTVDFYRLIRYGDFQTSRAHRPKDSVQFECGCVLCLRVSVWLRIPAIAVFPADLLLIMMNIGNPENVIVTPAA